MSGCDRAAMPVPASASLRSRFWICSTRRQSLSWYLDASVMIPILVKEPASAAVDAFMSSVQQEPWVSDFAAADVASALSRLVRTGRLEASVGAASLSDFDVWRAAMTRPAEIYAADIRLGRSVCPQI